MLTSSVIHDDALEDGKHCVEWSYVNDFSNLDTCTVNSTDSRLTAGVNRDLKVSEWSDDQAAKIREIIGAEFKVEGNLRSEIQMNIKRLMDIGCLIVSPLDDFQVTAYTCLIQYLC